MIDIATAVELKESESPELTVFDALNAPAHRRRGVPVESKISTPVIVAAGRFENVMVELFDADPDDADEKVIVARAYEPPEISVPADVFVPVALSSANLIGVVTALNVAVPTHASRS